MANRKRQECHPAHAMHERDGASFVEVADVHELVTAQTPFSVSVT